MGKLVQHSFSYALILIWVIFWLLGRRNDLTELLAGKGLDQIGHQYYRFGTALLLHKNLAELKFKLETWYGNWILIYAVLSNFPILGNDSSILVIHGFSLLLGMLFGGIAIGFRFF